MDKCPRCGYTLQEKEKKAYGNNIRHITMSFSRLTRTLLRKTSTLIMSNIPSDNSQQKYYNFVKVIQNVDENVIRRMLSNYLEANHAAKGKGFRYLQSMILSENQNKEKKLSNEYKSSGRSPSFDLVKGE